MNYINLFLGKAIVSYLILVSSLGLLGTKLEVFGPLKGQMLLGLTFLALQTENDLTCGLGLLVEDGLRLTLTPFCLESS